jgi:asparagine synthase (glutamine-hydrolysing)
MPQSVESGLRHVVRAVRGTTDPGYYWLSPRMRQLVMERRQAAAVSEKLQGPPWQCRLRKPLENAFSTVVLEEAERMASSRGIELRQPMRTAAFVQFAFSTPERLRLQGDRTKYVHVQAMRKILPDNVLHRRSKAEFSIVFREHLDQMENVLTKSLPNKHSDWLDQSGMARLFEEYYRRDRTGLPMWRLWSIYATACFAAHTRVTSSSPVEPVI